MKIVEAKWEVPIPIVFGDKASYVRTESYGFTERDSVSAYISETDPVLYIDHGEKTYAIPLSRVHYLVYKEEAKQ